MSSDKRKEGIQRQFLLIQHADDRRRQLDSMLNDRMRRIEELGQSSTDYLDVVDRGFHIEKIKALHWEIKKLLAYAIEDNDRKQRIAEKMYDDEVRA